MRVKSARQGHNLDETLYAVSDSQVQELCAANVIEAAHRAFATPDVEADVTQENVATLLSLTAGEVESMLHALDLDAGSVSIASLCKAAVRSIPSVLHQAAPAVRDTACTDKACEGTTVDVSMEALKQIAVQTLPQVEDSDEDEDGVFELPASDNSSEASEHAGVSAAESLRLLLHVPFGIFPATNEVDDYVHGEESSLSQMSGDPLIGAQFDKDQHKALREATVTAVAWTSAAVRNMDTSKVVKWFGADKTTEVRRMLTRGLVALDKLRFEKDRFKACEKKKWVAYVASKCGKNPEEYVSAILAGLQPKSCGQMDKAGHYVINICDAFWEYSHVFQIGSVAHEATHHFGTKDKTYVEYKIRHNLSTLENLNNAATYSYYVADVNGHPSYRTAGLVAAVWRSKVL